MRIDWIIALVVFIMFTGWAFAYYSLFSDGRIVSISESAGLAGEKIIDYMEVRLSSIPANFSLGGAPETATLYAFMNWTGNEKNSTRVVKSMLSNATLPCMISGDKIYWNASLATGDNFFILENVGMDSPMDCEETFVVVEDKQVMLWAADFRDVFSTTRNSVICSQMNNSYSLTKSTIGITFDFNILIGTEADGITCGSPIPRTGTGVFVYPATGALFEGGEINMSVRLW